MSNPGTLPEAGQSFDALWAEEGGAPATPQAKPSEAQVDQQEQVPAATATDSSESTQAGDGAQQADAGAEQTAADDWLASLPEEVQDRVRSERKAAEDRYNALHGRLAPTQRALSEANQRLAQAVRPQAPPAQATPQQQDSYFDSDGWKRYAEDFPGDAKVMREAIERQTAMAESRYNSLAQRLDQLSQGVSLATSHVQDTAIQKQVAELEKLHPDWQDVNQSQEFWDWFDGYRSSQPAALRSALYSDDALSELFTDARWTAERISDFKAQTGFGGAVSAQTAAAPESTQPAASNAQARPSGAARLRMAAAPDVRGGGSSPRGAVPIDSLPPRQAFEALWNQPD